MFSISQSSITNKVKKKLQNCLKIHTIEREGKLHEWKDSKLHSALHSHSVLLCSFTPPQLRSALLARSAQLDSFALIDGDSR